MAERLPRSGQRLPHAPAAQVPPPPARCGPVWVAGGCWAGLNAARGGGGITGRDTYRGQREGEKRGGRSLHCNFCRGVTLTAVSRSNRNSDPVSFCSPPSVLFLLSARYRPPSALRPLPPSLIVTATACRLTQQVTLPPALHSYCDGRDWAGTELTSLRQALSANRSDLSQTSSSQALNT